jgi:hypothetical protein
MQIKRGRPAGIAKTGGRQKGTPNAITTVFRGKIDTLLNDNWNKIQEDINSLEPKDRLLFMEKLLNFAVPKLASTTSEMAVELKIGKQLEDEIYV